MAKLVKSGENEWKVLDDNCLIIDAICGDKIISEHRPTEDEMLELGIVYLSGDDFMFIPETESGVEHNAGHLREIADLMDGLRG
jgi:hypothetical protein